MRYAILAAATLLAAAAPAAAQDAGATFTGPRVGANVGFFDDDIFGTESFSYGVEAGFDVDAGGVVLGGTAELQDSDDSGREIFVGGRLGGKVASNGLIYATAGYSNLEVVDGFKLDGIRVGVGGELALGKNVFAKVEQRYTNYALGAEGYQTVLGVGLRF